MSRYEWMLLSLACVIGLSACSVASPPIVPKSPQSTSGRYTDHGNYTVTDNLTKLMWQQCGRGQKLTLKGCEGLPMKFTWSSAMSGFAKDSQFAGHGDWRMPTHQELRTLVWCGDDNMPVPPAGDGGVCEGRNAPVPAINGKVFPNTHGAFWSSSNSEGEQGEPLAWFVDFDHDTSGRAHQNAQVTLPIRLVRDAP
jgi:hypothetical protein